MFQCQIYFRACEEEFSNDADKIEPFINEPDPYVINRPPEPKIVWLEGWEERELFSDGLDGGF